MMDRDRFPVDPWRLVETRYSASDEGVTETMFAIGNGYLGMRGNHPEGRHAHEHGTFINGFHETFAIRHAEQAYGFAEVGQTIVNAPDGKIMRVYVDDEPLTLDVAEMREYERSLDMREGVLHRHILWRTPSGKNVVIDMDRLVSFDERHLALEQISVTVLDADASVVISSQLVNRQDGGDVYGAAKPAGHGSADFDPRKAERFVERILVPQEHHRTGSQISLSYRVARSGMTLAVVADHVVETDNAVEAADGFADGDTAKVVFHVEAKAGVPTTVTKFLAYHTSRSVPTRELIDRARRTIRRAMDQGADAVFRAQAVWMNAFWERSDVQIPGQDALQQAVRWNLLQLAQAAARADSMGIAAKGVSGSGYSGHYFWDTEIYVLPFMAYTSPMWARNALRMRSLMLPSARKRARQLNEAGALFPWRTINGEEASAYYAAGTAQYHINADVTYALAKYVRASGDTDFLFNEGIDIAVETARLWATLGFWRSMNGEDSFHIHGVTGPDEYTTVVNDNLFTNIMARFNLRYAAESVRELASADPAAYDRMADRLKLDPTEADAWDVAADALSIPYSDALGIHPQDSAFLEKEVWDLENTPADKRPLLLHFHPLVIYRFQVLKQADVVLGLFLQGDQFTPEQKRADFDYYDPLTTGDSTLSAVVQSILAAEVGYRDLAMHYFTDALFVDLADLHHNAADGVHVASAGGVWTALVSGFGGMRDHRGALTFDPRLPITWPELRFPLRWGQSQLDIAITADTLTATVREGEDVIFHVRGERYVAPAGGRVVVPLADQGPSLSGRPSVRELEDQRLEDGSLISVSVPTSTTPITLLDAINDEGHHHTPTQPYTG
ncbi:glycoside hydrolase family 65 protein [Microbacterium sp. NC79]|uniref:glycoside hydrolase family 65 protein n=1 Tax=Microbacterium sp. NC79 TaxID=2851009 RepID=UPI001C2BAB61|nr:glycosyl hydrolase family 65 protein [Microbacterium sp. NC79]MBV0895544.1 glycoside hydrolase family 65 protein [Microbacterium sp. NC79]